MLDVTGQTCSACDTPLERLRYFPRQLITADDMRTEQHYLRERMKRHNRFLHGFGVVCGCEVIAPTATSPPWQLTVCPGYAVSPQGDEILIPQPVTFDLQTGVQNPDSCTPPCPCPPQPVCQPPIQQSIGYLCVRYTECVTRPVRVHPAGCGCDQLDCEYSRIRDSYELKLLWALPAAYPAAQTWESNWRTTVAEQRQLIRENGLPAPPCMPCSDDPWVLLATITIPASAKTSIVKGDIKTNHRRVLLGTEALQIMTEVFANV
jgi:hypothetical protein